MNFFELPVRQDCTVLIFGHQKPGSVSASLVICSPSLVICYPSLVICYPSLVSGHLLPITGHLPSITGHLLPITGHLLPITGHLLSITGHLLPITGHLPSITGHLLPITGHLLPITGHLLSITGHLLPITGHRLPNTIMLNTCERICGCTRSASVSTVSFFRTQSSGHEFSSKNLTEVTTFFSPFITLEIQRWLRYRSRGRNYKFHNYRK